MQDRESPGLLSFLDNRSARNKATRNAIAEADLSRLSLDQCKTMLDRLSTSHNQDDISATLHAVESMAAQQRERLSRIRRKEAEEAVQRAFAILNQVEASLDGYSRMYPSEMPLRIDNSHYRMGGFDDVAPTTLVAYCSALSMRIFHRTSRPGASLVLKLTKLYGYSLTLLNGGPNILQQQVLRDTPEDVRTVEKRINLGIRTVPYAVCQSCRRTHEPTYIIDSDKPRYPQNCQEEFCGADLVLSSGAAKEVFEYHPFFDWFGRLITLPGVVAHGDRFCESVDRQREAPDVQYGVEDGHLVRSLPAHDSEDRFFIADRGEEKRWLFALHVDFFNAEGNSMRGRKASTGHIVMTCLNLPLTMRNDDAYKYLAAVIQGPEEPSAVKGQYRHYLRPLLRDLKLGYTRGVRFSTTGGSGIHQASSDLAYRYIQRMILAILVADVKAARPCAGLLDITSHNFCYACRCWIQAYVGRVDYEVWEAIDDRTLKEGARAWKEASSEERTHIEERYAARDSELWELPYWKPSQQMVVDPMHTWFLIVLQRFFREAMGLDPSARKLWTHRHPAFYHAFTLPPSLSSLSDTVSKAGNGMTYKVAVQMGIMQNKLTAPMNDPDRDTFRLSVKHISNEALTRVCLDLTGDTGVSQSLLETMSKDGLADVLFDWRITKPLHPMQWTAVNHDVVIQTIRQAVVEISMPTWMKDKPPHDVGLSQAGTLKANQWRWLYRVYVPLALMLIWHPDSPYALPNARAMKPILDMNMNLTSATIILVKHHVTEESRDMFRAQLKAHVLGLRLHFPGFIFPGYHLAFHIPDFMALLGPARNWWCFPFERLAGKLQRIPKSHKIGQSEHTMLHSFLKGSVFRQWLLHPDSPPLLQYCRSLVDKAFRFVVAASSDDTEEDARMDADEDKDDEDQTTELDRGELDGKKRTRVPADLLGLLNTDDITCYSRVPAPKGFYCTQGSNSYVCVRSADCTPGSWVSARIQHILDWEGDLRFVVQYAHSRPNSHQADAFAHYWDTGFEAQRVSSAFDPGLWVVEADQIIAHAARWALKDGTALVVNLSDVGSKAVPTQFHC
ncbi:hypothetical protein BD626DRAFT_408605 [Schizophyllum amplum]|uniref:Uncharacterized protein n=1 Tax=Schizophyllum amplum TaxID=97359 RepID=A0A550C4Q5_9AGAR|nr:hypothetical protein BD626DRAFT_408605 [Auriculariopsis ampla]